MQWLEVWHNRRHLFAIVAASTILAANAGAVPMAFEGTLGFATIGPVFDIAPITGAGVANVNQGGADLALNTLTLAGGITGTVLVPVTDPETTGTVASIIVDASLGSGVLRPFAASMQSQPFLTQNTVPLRGSLRVCLLFPGCVASRSIPFTKMEGATGIGVGGLIATQLLPRTSLVAAPWTVGTAFLPVTTAEGSIVSLTSRGFAHGPLFFTGSTALPGGVLQLVTPVAVRSLDGPHPLTMFATITLRFLPEPGVSLLLLSGVVGLVLMGRNRARR